MAVKERMGVVVSDKMNKTVVFFLHLSLSLDMVDNERSCVLDY